MLFPHDIAALDSNRLTVTVQHNREHGEMFNLNKIVCMSDAGEFASRRIQFAMGQGHQKILKIPVGSQQYSPWRH